MGAVKTDIHSKERSLDSKYAALDNADGIKRLLRDYNALKERRFAGDYAACDILVDLERAIERAGLTDRQREALRLVFAGQLTQEEAGEALGCTKQTVNRLVNVGTTKVARVYEYWARHGEGYGLTIDSEGER
ncbi:sigma factor-like helix-turn-helix DNA-binding protein [Heyndrickxia sporothermodurans]|uniref:sigma factor-like helix-turn-helix DNA-binding protein n=1 Tax=Heyndrickxia sporothermodurans TaxID=46224 RepID=UPI002E1AD60A|nr:sigma factor-like helix-turn-helix DNA-binding protein [Heyndrickxia sporothermodurans]MED3649968.1 sigma factor-like helix-turn-helix DNA-binding protein [Heyndrickxia sporothermodurans]MED3697954.1 sigma factor-like helix-turn-helix DNA-binding protein [Heyndrickxia sporothermodurans]